MIDLIAIYSFLNKQRRMILFALLSISLVACASSPPQAVYVLDIASPDEVGTKTIQDVPVLEIAHVVLPEYLDTTDIVQRNGAQIVASPTGRWGDRLSIELTRSLAAYIASGVSNMTITMNALSQPSLYRLLVDVETFDVQSSNEVKLTARWTLLDKGAHKILAARKTVAIEKMQGTGDADIVGSMRRTIIILAKQITSEVAIIQPRPLKP